MHRRKKIDDLEMTVLIEFDPGFPKRLNFSVGVHPVVPDHRDVVTSFTHTYWFRMFPEERERIFERTGRAKEIVAFIEECINGVQH